MNAYNQYQENQILSASPEQILLMLYDGAIRFTRQAMVGIESKDLQQTHRGIKNAMAIITEFANSLNHEIGGEISKNLESLYEYMVRELLLANLHKDIEKLKEVDKLLVDLRSTWAEAVEIAKQAQPVKEMPAPAKVSSTRPDNFARLSISG